MSITVTESCNLNTSANQQQQQQPITTQPQAHPNQLHNSYKPNYTPYQATPSTGAQQLTNLTASGQMNKKTGQSQTQLKTIGNQKPTSTIASTNNNQPGYRKVFVQRDYSEGTSVRFQDKFPDELEGYIERQHFDYLIKTLNCFYDKAEAANLSTFCEGFCACMTAYLINICMESHYEKYMRKTRDYINEQNDLVWKPRGLYVTDPIDRGLRILEITIGPRAQQKTMLGDQFKRE